MAGGQERVLRRRIRSVQSTKKITRSFELIAASQIVRAQGRIAGSRPYIKAIADILAVAWQVFWGSERQVSGLPFLDAATVAALRSEIGDAHAYPGSPWLAAHRLRAQDRGICWEILPAECRALERALGGFRRMRVECADGYGQLRAVLPPRERRCLLLIDPPYENPAAELEQAIQAIVAVLQRLANCVILLWYPIKDERTLAPWLSRVERALAAPSLSLELWIYPRDSRIALNGSGLLLVNPTYQFEQRAALWQPQLQALLDKAQHGGSSSQWLVRDSGVDHASA